MLDRKAGAAALCPLVCIRCAWYCACRAWRSAPTLAVAAFESEVRIPTFSTPRSWIAGAPPPWAEVGGAVEPRTQVTAPSARRRDGRKRVSLRVFILNVLQSFKLVWFVSTLFREIGVRLVLLRVPGSTRRTEVRARPGIPPARANSSCGK